MSGRTPAAIKQTVARQVREAREKGEPVNELVNALAKAHGVSRATVFRWADGHHLAPRTRVSLTLEELQAVAAFQGNVLAAHENLRRRGQTDLSYRQFCRRLDNVDTDLRAAVTEGLEAAKAAGLYNVQIGQYQRGDVFGFDHTEIPVFVRNPGEKKPHKMWISVVADWATGVIFRPTFTEGDESLRGDPNTTSIVALAISVMLGQELDNGPVIGGIPSLFVFDNAAAHFAEEIANGFAHLGVTAHAIRPGSPWENGPTENAINVVERLIWSRLPGYTHHLPTRYGKSLWNDDDLLSPEELIAFTAVGIERINREKPMKRHGGRTRLQAWQEASGLMAFAELDKVRHLFTRSEGSSRKVHKSGVHFKNIWYSHTALAGHVGRSVEVRSLQTDPSFIDVYLNGELLCTATPAANLSDRERHAIAKQRRSRLAKADRIQKASKERIKELADQQQVDAILAGEQPPEPNGEMTWDGWEVDAELKDLLELGKDRFGVLDFDLTADEDEQQEGER